MMPANPLVGGVALRRPAIQSPNFVTKVSGWTINADGSAEFNNLTIRGVFNGTNFVMNSSGLFFYSGTPAANNLIESHSPASGTDSFGNAYLQGSVTYQQGVSQWTAIAQQSITGGAQLAWYYTTGLTETGWILGGSWAVVAGVASPTGSPLQYAANGQGLLIGTSTAEPVSVTGYFQLANQTAPAGKSGFATLFADTNSTLAEMHGSGYGPAALDRTITDMSVHGPVTGTTLTAFSNSYSVNAGDLVVGSEVILETNFHGTWPSTASSLQFTLEIGGTQFGTFLIGAVAITGGDAFGGTLRYHVKCKTTGAGGTMNLSAEGSIGDTTANRLGSNSVSMVSKVQGGALNTTVANTFQLFTAWNASGTGQTVTSDDSSFTRRGF